MERALLEGEHQTEMGQLQSDQEKINQLKEKQNMLIEKATREREKVGCKIMSRAEKISFLSQLIKRIFVEKIVFLQFL